MKKLFRKAVSLSVAAMMIFSLSATGFAAVDKAKTATVLKEDQTTVTLSLGADQEKTASDVVFVFDKSTSVDVRAAAVSMLEELKGRAEDNVIKVGVVIFNKEAHRELELTELNDENFAEIKEALETSMSSGTNIDAGLRAGKAMLDEDATVADNAKHLVLVTDGVTYLWGDEPTSLYSELTSYGEEKITAGNDMFSAHHGDEPNYVESFANASQWMADNGQGVQTCIDTYADKYEQGQYSADELRKGQNSTYVNSGNKKYIPGEILAETYCANDGAIYMAGKAWQAIVDAGYSGYAYADQKYVDLYPWAPNFIGSLSTIGGHSAAVPADTTGMFDDVKSSILYTIQQGTVTDVVGEDFDLIEGTFALSVDGQNVEGAIDSENPNKINFGTAADGVYPYTVEYFAGDVQQKEQFKWTINVPVPQGNQLKLSYDLKLVDKETEPGTYKVPTNESAVLDYTGTDGSSGSEVFEIPYVEYTVEEPDVPPAPTYYTVIYNDGVEDEVVFPDQMYSGLTYGILTPEFQGTPTREGYVFKGWEPAVADRVTGNAIYKAVWEKVEEPPVDPEEPPVDPEEPIDPDVPVDPEKPEAPEKPVKPEEPAEPEEMENGDIPRTGDDSMELAFWLFLVLTAGGLTVCTVKMKKNR